MMIRLYACLLALCLLAAPAAATAQDGNGHEIFRAADSDRDRQVTLGEFQAVRNARFDDRDRNRDGFLSSDDLRGFAGAAASQRAGQRLAEIDLDGDGRVSRREFSNHGLLQFENADADNDGAVSRAEIAALAR